MKKLREVTIILESLASMNYQVTQFNRFACGKQKDGSSKYLDEIEMVQEKYRKRFHDLKSDLI